MHNSYASHWIYIYYVVMLYSWIIQHIKNYTFRIVSEQAIKVVFLRVKQTVGSSHFLLMRFFRLILFVPQCSSTTEILRPMLEVQVARSRQKTRQCKDTFYMQAAQMQCKQPPWEVLGGCRLFVASGDWNYILWSDVTSSPTPHHWNTQTVLTHAHAWLLSLLLYWLVRVIHFCHQQRNSVTGSLQIPTGGWECPHIYRRQTWTCMLLPDCCCLVKLRMTYFPP